LIERRRLIGCKVNSPMPNEAWSKADYYWNLVDECVTLAERAASNGIRAEYYATAEYYLHLAEIEANFSGRMNKHLRSREAGSDFE
jgi:hypothetical protein